MTLVIVGVVLLVLVALWLVPLALIWSLNTLFMLSIGYTWETWAAMLLLSAVLSASASRSR